MIFMTMKSLSKLFTTASLLLFLESTYNKIWKEKNIPDLNFIICTAQELFQEVPIWLERL